MKTANGDCYVNDPDNISVWGGQVHLTARTEAQPFVCHSPYGDFTTQRTVATIGGWGKFTQTYGRFEFRARFPAVGASGVHSALWLYPQKHTYGAWPASGEIDVAEWFSADADNVYPSVHYSGEDPLRSTGYDCVVPDAGGGYHRYAVEWTPTQMRFLYDGRLCFTHAWTPAAPLRAPQPFDQPFYLVLSHAFGAGWNAMVAGTPSTSTMDVDWVRVWK
jgi:beta-glucanase (GH16 family)